MCTDTDTSLTLLPPASESLLLIALEFRLLKSDYTADAADRTSDPIVVLSPSV